MSYSFAGSGDQISYGHISGFDAQTKATFSYWIKSADALSGYAGIISQIASPNGFAIDTNTERLGMELAACDGVSASMSTSSAKVLTADVWNHVYVVYDGTQAEADRWDVWVNGSAVGLAATSARSSFGTTAGGVNFLLGYNAYAYFVGKLAEVAIWIGEAVTDAGVISGLYNSGSGALASAVRSSGLDFYARLKANANDSAGSLTGTVTGATLDGSDHPVADGGAPTWTPRVTMVMGG